MTAEEAIGDAVQQFEAQVNTYQGMSHQTVTTHYVLFTTEWNILQVSLHTYQRQVTNTSIGVQ